MIRCQREVNPRARQQSDPRLSNRIQDFRTADAYTYTIKTLFIPYNIIHIQICKRGISYSIMIIEHNENFKLPRLQPRLDAKRKFESRAVVVAEALLTLKSAAIIPGPVTRTT
jgi:hypothetical protein